MGNCFSLKHKKKELDQDHPTVSRWLASCDFSSVPDIDDFSTEVVEERSPDYVIYDSVLGGDHLVGYYDVFNLIFAVGSDCVDKNGLDHEISALVQWLE
ncbi:hypothetical protein TELCIR_04400 [Teladorsagia circumcincta]|uniref:Uncharacterized protein n=1 Tax=Teladorsagia circumcincta TaxID=45464 RepID=A0A2G9UTQ1_TELCI|nr:hypothetical protein TELCIR_04400 [Teladorsagia circumcincta]